jgi:hypothetical protein
LTFFKPQFTTHPPRIHHQNTTTKHSSFPIPHQKTPAKPEKPGPTGAPDLVPKNFEFSTAGNSKPARNTDWDKHTAVVEVVADSAASSAAAAAPRRLAGSTPPETPS